MKMELVLIKMISQKILAIISNKSFFVSEFLILNYKFQVKIKMQNDDQQMVFRLKGMQE